MTLDEEFEYRDLVDALQAKKDCLDKCLPDFGRSDRDAYLESVGKFFDDMELINTRLRELSLAMIDAEPSPQRL